MEKNVSIKNALLSIGLESKEANTYLALLHLGRGSVSMVARKAGINRTTGYVVLDALVRKGLASVSGKKPKLEYIAESPDALGKYLRKRLLQAEQRVSLSTDIIPQLKSLRGLRGQPQIMFYEGRDGLIKVYEDTLTAQEDIRAIASIESMTHTLPGYFPRYYKRRAVKNIGIRAIFPDTPDARERIKHNAEEKRESVLVPADEYSFSPEINIYDNKIMIASWLEKLGIIIESAEIADAMKKLFDLAWQEARRINNRLV